MRLSSHPLLLVATLVATSVPASAQHQDEATTARARDAARLQCTSPTRDDCLDVAYRRTACGERHQAICAGLLVESYAGPHQRRLDVGARLTQPRQRRSPR